MWKAGVWASGVWAEFWLDGTWASDVWRDGMWASFWGSGVPAGGLESGYPILGGGGKTYLYG
jgi:hypothetical protein